MKRVIAIDLGASNGMLVLAQLNDGKLDLKELHRFPNGPIKKDNQLFWDISSIMEEIKTGLKKYADHYEGPLHGIGIDTWGVDFGLVSGANTLLELPYSYRGSHTEGIMEDVHKLINAKDLFKRTGVESAPINTLYQLAGIIKERPDLIKETSVILTMPSLINFLLTGEKANEFTHGSTTQLINQESQTWDRDIMKAVFSKELPLAKLRQTNTVIGTTTEELNKEIGSTPIPVINIPGHDTACALAALPIEHEHTAFMSCGTWVLIGTEIDKPVVTEEAYEWGFTNEGTIDKKYRLQKNNMGLWLLQQVKKEWELKGEVVSYKEEAQLLAQAEPFQSFIDPDNALFFNPPSMIKAIQEFCERTEQIVPETKGEIIRCIIESLALKYKWIINRLEHLTNNEIALIHMGGGGIQNETLCQFVANATNKPVKTGPIEASAIGNALSQFIALGDIEDLSRAREISKQSFKLTNYEPMSLLEWEDAYDRLIRLI